ncbi:MFS transporter [Streptomyces sp. PSAA01]|uniref:MFS transporter n=1 Tax=Streptomyces sp. PSAA01 TaxID=2912762 RepID=UPI001F29F4B9|nr:MFS transporter [Streptomyces sp. PSAA01]MCG0288294.1 MFS transporter [Streptomyces sp. PSAA01]
MRHTTPTTLPPTGDLGGSSKSEATDSRAAEGRATDNRAADNPATDSRATRGPVVRGRRAPRPGWLLAIVLTGQLMAVLDVFIVNIAAPTVRADLHASGAGLQLVIAGYTISYAVLLITGARLGALIGHRRMFLTGLAVFTGASLACGLAATTGQLVAFRFVQGGGAALMLPQVLSLIQRTFTGGSRARALGAYAAVLASGAAGGQIVGGALVEADLLGSGWRPVFLVNVPIGLLLLILGPRLLHEPAALPLPAAPPRPADPPLPAAPPRPRAEGPAARRSGPYLPGLDLPGLVLLAAAVLLFTVPLVLGQERGWPLWGWITLGLSAVLVALFAAYETRLARRGGTPLISPRVVRAPGMPLAVIRIALGMAANAGFMFAMTLHVQGGLGYSPLRAGLTFVPMAVAFGVVGLNWQRLPARWQAVAVPGGFLLAAASFAGAGLVLRGGTDGGPWLLVALTAAGAGLSFAYSPLLTRTLTTVRQQDAADASGVLVTAAQLGLLTGVAVFGAVFLGATDGTVPSVGASAGALWVTCVALAGAALCGVLMSLVRRVGNLR